MIQRLLMLLRDLFDLPVSSVEARRELIERIRSVS